MPGKRKENLSPRIENRRAYHDYFITLKVECGMALLGSEVKSLRLGKAQLQESFARIENGELILHGCHIDPYEKAALVTNHEPRRDRKLLAHRREIRKLAGETEQGGVTLVPLAIYFKEGARSSSWAWAVENASTTSATRSSARKWIAKYAGR